MSFRLPRLYPITDTQISGLSHAAQVQLMAEGGATLVQLRDKYAAPREFYREAMDALAVARQLGLKVIINDRVDIAHSLKADGVHLGQDDMPAAAARELLGPDSIIGLSTHNPGQVGLALNEPVDYIAFGPVFSTLSKGNPDPIVGLEGLRTVRKKIGSKPLVAIGGITMANGPDVLLVGADSLAVIKAILEDPTEIASRVRAFLASQPSSF
jgi:thiamine-phosphate pyrophosphorylase